MLGCDRKEARYHAFLGTALKEIMRHIHLVPVITDFIKDLFKKKRPEEAQSSKARYGAKYSAAISNAKYSAAMGGYFGIKDSRTPLPPAKLVLKSKPMPIVPTMSQLEATGPQPIPEPQFKQFEIRNEGPCYVHTVSDIHDVMSLLKKHV